jgi:ribosome modulation factor
MFRRAIQAANAGAARRAAAAARAAEGLADRPNQIVAIWDLALWWYGAYREDMIEVHNTKPILCASALDAEGFGAGAAGEPAGSNPYEAGTQAPRHWLRGWQDGRASTPPPAPAADSSP